MCEETHKDCRSCLPVVAAAAFPKQRLMLYFCLRAQDDGLVQKVVEVGRDFLRFIPTPCSVPIARGHVQSGFEYHQGYLHKFSG